MIDIVIVSDIKIYLEGLRQLLSSRGRINVIATANSSQKAVTVLSNQLPHAVLLDMTTSGSCELATYFVQQHQSIKIIALGITQNEPNILRYARAGISCYVPRDATVDELVAAIGDAANGDCYCPPEIAGLILNNLRDAPAQGDSLLAAAERGTDDPPHTFFSSLTPREREVVVLLSEGLSNKQISSELCIELSTVKNHVHNLLTKLNAKNRVQAACILQNAKGRELPTASQRKRPVAALSAHSLV